MSPGERRIVHMSLASHPGVRTESVKLGLDWADPGLTLGPRSLAASGLPQLSARADIVRYRAYQAYLTELTTLYASELRVVDMGLFRRVMTGRSA